MINFTNFAQSRMTADITSVGTTLTVQDGDLFPSSDFHIVVETEIMYVSSRSGNNLTVIRARQGTTATAHNIGAKVTQSVSRDDLKSFQTIVNSINNRPVASILGRRFVGTTTPIESVDNGTTWKSRIFGHLINEYADTDFVWLNQGSATLTTTYGYPTIVLPTGSGVNIRGRYKSVPTAPYTVSALIDFPNLTGNQIGGLFWRASATGSITMFGLAQDGQLYISKYTNATTFSANYTPTFIVKPISRPIWLAIEDDTSNRKFHYSIDGINWITVFSIGGTDFHTPDQFGYGMSCDHGFGNYFNLYSLLSS